MTINPLVAPGSTRRRRPGPACAIAEDIELIGWSPFTPTGWQPRQN
jgi:hypothetical protein